MQSPMPDPTQNPEMNGMDDMGDEDMGDAELEDQPMDTGDERADKLLQTYNNLSDTNKKATLKYAESLEDSEEDDMESQPMDDQGMDDQSMQEPEQEPMPESIQRRTEKVIQEVMDELMNGRKKMKRPEKKLDGEKNPFIYQ